MKTVLAQLNAVPGVVGSMVCGSDGRVMASAFPPVFDEAALDITARVLADGAIGLESATGKVTTLDLRFADSRLVLRPMAASHLVLLCTSQVNLQLVNISTAVAVPKLEKLVAEQPPPAPAKREKSRPEKAKPEKATRPARPPDEDPGFFHW